MDRWVPSIETRMPASHHPRRLQSALLALAITVLIPGEILAASSDLYPSSKKEAGALKLAQVVGLASRSEILGLKKDYQRLLDSGLSDSVLVDKSVGLGRVFCCGGLPEATRLDALLFYIPPADSVELGDIVEIRLGQEPGKGAPGRINVVTQVRERANATEHRCRWDPPNERAWMRVIYCDWMPTEGWTHKKGIGNPWIKAPSRDTLP